jgi:DNA-binding CsgD family transcriptional regulator
MSCTAAIYADRPQAKDAQHRVSRMYHFATNVRYCESCDGYHLLFDKARVKLPGKSLQILRLMGGGYSRAEIAGILGISVTTVAWYIRRLIQTFNALSSNHLIAIAIAVGALSPNDFVPEVLERKTDAGTNGQCGRTI